MQGELNKKTREHLKFFYTEVLGIRAKDAEPDHAHIIFEVQKILQDQYQKYRVTEGTPLNGGRDTKNADVFFNTDNEIVVNEAQIAEVRTLFLNNEEVVDRSFVEGVYIAPASDKADGIQKDFKTEDPKNWYTLGNKFSKYIAPGKTTAQRYPAARLGFLFASPVLYLAEGERTIMMTLDCMITPSICNNIEADCNSNSGIDCPDYPDIYDATQPNFYARVQTFLFDAGKVKKYYLISQDLLQDALNQGMSDTSVNAIRDAFLLWTGKTKLCSNDVVYRDYALIDSVDWDTFTASNSTVADEIAKLPELFKSRYPFKISFSGEKDWIDPSSITDLHLSALAGNRFTFTIAVNLAADKPAVTFYNKDNLGEDFGTELPMVKIELEDLPGFSYLITPTEDECCLKRPYIERFHDVSLYHFFRNVSVLKQTKIEVQVCGLRNFVVQNDENLMDVNSILFPFGTRPKVGANFLVSANEVFCKNWSEFDIKFDWKDLPPDFLDYYHGYEDKLTGVKIEHLDKNRFVFRYSFLEDGKWFPDPTPPFPAPPPPPADATNGMGPFHLLFKSDINPFCSENARNFVYKFTRGVVGLGTYKRRGKECFNPSAFRNDSRFGFLKWTLLNQDFQHSRYSFVLTRQMLAMGKLPEISVGPVYDGIDPVTNTTIQTLKIDEVFKAIEDAFILAQSANPRTKNILNKIRALIGAPPPPPPNVNVPFNVALTGDAIGSPLPGGGNIPVGTIIPDGAVPPIFVDVDLDKIYDFLEDPILKTIFDKIGDAKKIRVVIPKEPYTPQIQNMVIDYQASASLADIDMIHLYPYAGTSKPVEIELQPTLFPTFCDEGTLFIGLKDLQPGLNLDMLFQFAEATADSEKPKEKVHWHYLDNNLWKPLRTGFEVLEDATLDLTTTGIIKFALPENMTNKNAVMPPGLHWIKASIAKNSKAVSETIKIYTQAVSATFQISSTNDTSRLSQPLEAGSIAKLVAADPAIKTVTQPYETFGGSIPELDGSYYLRVSERLRHKGRAIQKWDYERLVLQEFPSVYKAKCINHSFCTDAGLFLNDVPYAGGYVIVAVVPDLRILKAGNSFDPKVPVSLLEKIEKYLGRITSPFVRLKAANPRYERINFCITVTLFHGKDKNYYKERLKSDLREFLAPWAVGKYDKLSFGQCVYRSDVLRFLERTGYIDFVSELRMVHENDLSAPIDRESICPVSPRSILIGGDIEVIVLDEKCEKWCASPIGIQDCPGPVPVQDYCSPNAVLT
jgi:hypothetical protein